MPDLPLRSDPGDRVRISALRPSERQRSAAGASRDRRPPPRGRNRGWLGGLLRLAVLLTLWGGIAGVGALAYFALTLPDTKQLTVAERRPSVTVLAADGSTIASLGDLFGQPMTLKEMSPYVPQAVVA